MKRHINLILLITVLFAGVNAVNAQSVKKPVFQDTKKRAEQDRQQREKVLAKLAEQKAQLQYEQKTFPATVAPQAGNGTQQKNIQSSSLSPAPSGFVPQENKAKSNR